jgi:hypothetical protein
MSIIGLFSYFIFIGKVIPKQDKGSFKINSFIAFASLGSQLLIALTVLFWEWSGLASLGFAFSFLIAPIFMGFILHTSFQQRQDKAYEILFKLSLSFFVAIPVIILLSFMME